MSSQPNRLVAETSPYLLQHAYNPVDWHPWGPEALGRAALLDRPIFLSIGYAACHWCHVMEKESFEDEETARLLNSGFVAIKVDREERPDLDAVYMAALQSLTGGGGWPMSLFLMPDGRPFYGGTYFPREPRHGLPSFRQILAAVAASWKERRGELETAAAGLVDGLRQNSAALAGNPNVRPEDAGQPSGPSPHNLWLEVVDVALVRLVNEFDFEHGGWAGPPRFPQPAIIELLLRRASGSADGRVVRTATRALDAMAHGGLHDQIGGGFHRYATDTDWLIPHFEKMLYDNAQLARVYLHAFQLTGEARFRTVAETTLDYMVRELRTPDGLFASSQDADTDGVEGATYVWTADEIEAVLGDAAEAPATQPPELQPPEPPGPGLSALFAAAYGVTAAGNWEGRTILSRVMSDDQVAAVSAVPVQTVTAELERAGHLLLARREARSQPALDDKAVAAWNGLALAAFAEAIPVLGRQADRAVAEGIAESALALLRNPDGRLSRSFRSGRTSGTGSLEDYACLADGLVSLYEATFDERWLVAAGELMEVVERQFADAAGGWFDTPAGAEPLIVRPKEVQDGATPSGGAAAAAVFLRLAELTGEERHRDVVERAAAPVERLAGRYPRAFPAWLGALDFASSSVAQVAIVGHPEAADTKQLVEVARRGFQPYRVLAVRASDSGVVGLLHDRFAIGGRATAFVCRDFTCRRPVTEPEDLAAELAMAGSPPRQPPATSPPPSR